METKQALSLMRLVLFGGSRAQAKKVKSKVQGQGQAVRYGTVRYASQVEASGIFLCSR